MKYGETDQIIYVDILQTFIEEGMVPIVYVKAN